MADFINVIKSFVAVEAFSGRVNYAWSVITHDRSKNKFLVIDQFHIIDHVIKTQIILTIFFTWYP